ncbi:MAG: peptidylprolyl isomerase, partial [Bacteroidia bacterium]|nr:peptidylprolyl isomerase [Bacteroidia bacterium]
MKRIIILAGSFLLLANAFAQKGKKPKPVTFEDAKQKNLAVYKVTAKKVNKKTGTIYSTTYIVDKHYEKFEDGIYAEFNTDSGNIICKLHYDKVPLTVCNFVGLAEGSMPNNFRKPGQPYYDSLKFHRVISIANGDGQDFMIQGGDPLGTGSGDPGYSFEDEFHPSLKHSGPGILSMANSGPGTNGSQFFITHTATSWLDNKHSIFGAVVEGMDVVHKVRTNTRMNYVRIIRKGAAALDFKADSTAFGAIREAKKRESDFANYDDEVLKRYPTAKKTASGLWYVVTSEGTGKQAMEGSQVKVHYKGTLPNGLEFDNSYSRNEPIGFAIGVGQVIPGWDEGIALMKEGSKYLLIIPSKLGYGTRGAGGVIPPNSTLIFETELVKVVEPNKDLDFATDAAKVLAKYPNAKKTASGLWYVVVEEGTGEQAESG